MVSTKLGGLEAVLRIENEHKKHDRKINLDIYITGEQLLKLKEGQIEGRLTWKRKDGKFDYAKKIFLELGKHYAGTSPIITTPFPHGQTVEKTVAYKAIIEQDSWIILYNNKEITGKTQKGSITTTVYVDRRSKPRY